MEWDDGSCPRIGRSLYGFEGGLGGIGVVLGSGWLRVSEASSRRLDP